MGWRSRRAERRARAQRAAPAFRQCPGCGYDFATGEGNPHCSDPPMCAWSVEGYRHAALAREFFGEEAR